jgi:hypothetical protein
MATTHEADDVEPRGQTVTAQYTFHSLPNQVGLLARSYRLPKHVVAHHQ